MSQILRPQTSKQWVAYYIALLFLDGVILAMNFGGIIWFLFVKYDLGAIVTCLTVSVVQILMGILLLGRIKAVRLRERSRQNESGFHV